MTIDELKKIDDKYDGFECALRDINDLIYKKH